MKKIKYSSLIALLLGSWVMVSSVFISSWVQASDEELLSTLKSDPYHNKEVMEKRKAARTSAATPKQKQKVTPSKTAFGKSLVQWDITTGQIALAKKINFLPGDDGVTDQSELVLKDLANLIKTTSDLAVRIEVHTDSLGSDQQNMEKTKKWADAIRNVLTQNGVPVERITLLAKGDLHPIASDVTPAGQEKNRRVEVFSEKYLPAPPSPPAPVSAPEVPPAPPVLPIAPPAIPTPEPTVPTAPTSRSSVQQANPPIPDQKVLTPPIPETIIRER